MNKNLTFIFLVVASILFSNCKENFNIKESDLTERIWTSDVVYNYCTDSLKFQTDNKVTYYSCEIGWEYDGFYKTYGDTIEIGINMTQLDVDKYDPHSPTSKYLLKFKKNELEWLKIEHFSHNGFEEVEPEIYEQLKNWKK